jgi:diketogulonate reductase-like aldo/keto reductase
VAFSPLGRPEPDSKDKPDINSIESLHLMAKKYGISVCEVILKWNLQRGCPVIPKSTNQDHQKTNLEIAFRDFTLSEEEMREISSLEKKHGKYRTSNKLPYFGAYDFFV